MGTDALIQECSQWKLLGVAAWHLGLYLLGAAVWCAAAPPWSPHFLGLFSFSAWLLSLLVYATCLLVLYTQRQVLTTLDVPPLYVSRLGWGGKSWPSLLITRCIIRRRKLRDVLDVALFYAACCFSACAGLYMLQPAGDSSRAGALAAVPHPVGMLAVDAQRQRLCCLQSVHQQLQPLLDGVR
jgi:hypothetical protein